MIIQYIFVDSSLYKLLYKIISKIIYYLVLNIKIKSHFFISMPHPLGFSIIEEFNNKKAQKNGISSIEKKENTKK